MSLAFGTASLACTAALGLLLFGLGFAVSRARFARRRGSGHDDDPRDLLHKLVRAHANTAEFAPVLAVLFLAHGARGFDKLLFILSADSCLLLRGAELVMNLVQLEFI